jgi:hypothetical protein
MRREPNTRKGPAKPARDRSDGAFLSAEYVLDVMPRALRKTRATVRLRVAAAFFPR